jgi:uncharacterized membrane protein YqgA involved in biofilm formation
VVLEGTLVNVAAILVGAFIGWRLHRIPMKIRNTLMQGIGLSVVVMGISLVLQHGTGQGHDADFIIMIISLVVGGAIGEWIDIEAILESVGQAVESRLRSGAGADRVTQAFITATLVYCVGAMAILGSLQSGLERKHDILFTKSLLDGVSAILFTSTLGPGVALASIPVFLYQGSIAVLAGWLQHWMIPPILNIVTATGGILILGIGLNLLQMTTIRVGNLLPALLVAAFIRGALAVIGW